MVVSLNIKVGVGVGRCLVKDLPPLYKQKGPKITNIMATSLLPLGLQYAALEEVKQQDIYVS